MRPTGIAIIGIVALSFLIALLVYPSFPDRIVSHWDANGIADGYMPKLEGLFLMPFISILFVLLFFGIPKIDPMKFNIEKFRPQYEKFVLIVMLFLLYLFLLTIWWTMGARFNIIQALAPAFAGLFYYAGVLMGHAKMNWFIGVRTPWTMMNENVWDRTNKLGGKLFKVAAMLALVSYFLGGYAIWLVVGPVVLFSIYLVFYSYREYQKEAKGKKIIGNPRGGVGRIAKKQGRVRSRKK